MDIQIITDEYAALGQAIVVDGVKVGRVKKSTTSRGRWTASTNKPGVYLSGCTFATKSAAVAFVVKVCA